MHCILNVLYITGDISQGRGWLGPTGWRGNTSCSEKWWWKKLLLSEMVSLELLL